MDLIFEMVDVLSIVIFGLILPIHAEIMATQTAVLKPSRHFYVFLNALGMEICAKFFYPFTEPYNIARDLTEMAHWLLQR